MKPNNGLPAFEFVHRSTDIRGDVTETARIELSFSDSTTEDLCEAFERFLKACGFHMDAGESVIITDRESNFLPEDEVESVEVKEQLPEPIDDYSLIIFIKRDAISGAIHAVSNKYAPYINIHYLDAAVANEKCIDSMKLDLIDNHENSIKITGRSF